MSISKKDKVLATVSYLTLIGAMAAYYLNHTKHPFVVFHVKQALGLWLSYHGVGLVVSQLDSWLVSVITMIFFGVLLLFGLINAVRGETEFLPLFGKFFKKLFSNLN